MKRKALSILILYSFFLGCASIPKSSEEVEKSLKLTAVEKYKSGYEILYNSLKDFSIVVKQNKPTSLNPNPALLYFVYDMKNDKIIFEDNPGQATIVWKSEYQLEVRKIPGNISTEMENKAYGYVYDISKKQKIDLNKLTESPNQ